MFSISNVFGTPILVLDASRIAPDPVSVVTVLIPGILLYPLPLSARETWAIGPYALLEVVW